MNGRQEMDVKTEPSDLSDLSGPLEKERQKIKRGIRRNERPQKRKISVAARYGRIN